MIMYELNLREMEACSYVKKRILKLLKIEKLNKYFLFFPVVKLE